MYSEKSDKSAKLAMMFGEWRLECEPQVVTGYDSSVMSFQLNLWIMLLWDVNYPKFRVLRLTQKISCVLLYKTFSFQAMWLVHVCFFKGTFLLYMLLLNCIFSFLYTNLYLQ